MQEKLTKTKTIRSTRTYRLWYIIVARCTSKKNKDYKHYGAKGIKVCDRWLIYENFLKDLGEKSDDMCLGRLDKSKDYDSSNCKWMSRRDVSRSINFDTEARRSRIRKEGKYASLYEDIKKTRIKPKIKAHGLMDTVVYRRWASMKARCNNPRDTSYPVYGARGIKVCERWHSFLNFLEDMGDVPDNLQIDRIDVNGNYEPGNCRWVTFYENQLNKRIRESNREDFVSKERRKQMGFDIDVETHQRVKNISKLQDISMNLFMHRALLKYLREQELVITNKHLVESERL